jgi:FkbM family methyltransferase
MSDGMYEVRGGVGGSGAAGAAPWRADLRKLVDKLNEAQGMTYWGAVRTKRAAYAAHAAHVLDIEGRRARRVIDFCSQYGEDVTAWEMLGPQTRGFYVEAGAFDGRHFSVSYAFDAMGWDGLLVEPLPEKAAACLANRPTARVVQAALGRRGASGRATLRTTLDPLGGMFSYVGERKDVLVEGVANQGQVEVPLTSLDGLLEAHPGGAPTRIDLAVIDVEGGELDVLDGFDLERWKPRVLIVEDNTRGADAALTKFMGEHPYELAGLLEVNRIYTRRDEPELAKRSRYHGDLG